jgi:ferredoxin-thioredoxin reductase catalytic subunit
LDVSTVFRIVTGDKDEDKNICPCVYMKQRSTTMDAVIVAFFKTMVKTMEKYWGGC